MKARWITARFACLVAIAVLGCAKSGAQTLSPYSDFQALSQSDLSTLQVKLTCFSNFGGPPVGTLVFAASGPALNVGVFAPYYRSGYSYSTDSIHPWSAVASITQLRAIIDSVAVLPGVADGGIDSSGYVSFSLAKTAEGTKVFEAIVNPTNTTALMGQLLKALNGNISASNLVRDFACVTANMPSATPADMQSSVTIAPGGLRLDRHAADHYVGKVRVVNTSAVPIVAPIYLVAAGYAELVGAEGSTCNIEPMSKPYVTLVSSGSLAPGASVERTITLISTSGERPAIQYLVFAGAGFP